MKKIEKGFVWIENHQGLMALCLLSIGIIGLILDTTLTWGAIAKMMAVIFFVIIIVISLFILIKSSISSIRKPLNEEIEKLKSDLYGKSKQYAELNAKTRPCISVSELITCEVKQKAVVKVSELEDKDQNHYHLRFYLQVRNKTNYTFTTEKAFIACYHFSDLVFKKEWEQRAPIWNINISESLPCLRDGDIQFYVPIEKIDNTMRRFRLKGYVDYAVAEDKEIIHDIPPKDVKVGINLEYELDDEVVEWLRRLKGGGTE